MGIEESNQILKLFPAIAHMEIPGSHIFHIPVPAHIGVGCILFIQFVVGLEDFVKIPFQVYPFPVLRYEIAGCHYLKD
jgi:hypothetical protein